MRLKADLALLIIAILWGSAFVAQRIAGQAGGVFLFNGARYILAGVVVLSIAFWGRRRSSPTIRSDDPSSNREQNKWMLVAGILLFAASALQQMGLQYTTAGNAGFITSLYVVLVPVALYLGWSERPNGAVVAAVLVAAAGAFLLSTAGRFELRLGDTLELAGAFFWALHVALLGKIASRYEPMLFSAGQLLVCGMLNLLAGIFLEQPVFTWPLAGAVAYTAIFSLGISYTLQVWAQRHTPPSDAALILSLESVFAVSAGRLFLHEVLTGVQIFGALLIFLAVVLSQVSNWNSGRIDQSHLVEGR